MFRFRRTSHHIGLLDAALASGRLVENRSYDFLRYLPAPIEGMRAIPGFNGLGDPQPGKSFVAGWVAFIHRQEALVVGDHRSRGVY